MPDEDQFDKILLARIHARVPFVREPYAQLAEELGASERKILERMGQLRSKGGPVREISGVFDLPRLGYQQTLVAMKIPPEITDLAAQTAAAHPGVSHCYTRTGEYNLWFTLATSPRSRFGLEKTAEVLAGQARASAHLLLPVIKRYKLRVPLSPDLSSEEIGEPGSADEPYRPPPGAPPDLTVDQIAAIRSLQVDLPNRSDPFSDLAAAGNMTPDMLLVHAADFLGAGYMRRYSAVLHYRRTGSEANVLVAWRSDHHQADRAGALSRDIPAVSHCYLRGGTDENWAYSFYTMIHGRTREDACRTIDLMAARTGLKDRVELWTVREYKKRRVNLFSDEEQRWEAAVQGMG